MNLKFDPIIERKQLQGESGLKRHFAKNYEQIKADNSLTGNATFMLGDAIVCQLVGLDDAGEALLKKTHDWLEAANELGEEPRQYFKYGTEATRHRELAQCNWLLTGKHDAENLDQYVYFKDLYFLDRGQDKDVVDLTLPTYLEAGHYARAVELFESTRGLIKPARLQRITSVGKLAYVICLHRLCMAYTDEEIREAVEAFLKRFILPCLAHGHDDTALQWMKLTRWSGEETRAAACEALLHCYDYMPGVRRPGPLCEEI